MKTPETPTGSPGAASHVPASASSQTPVPVIVQAPAEPSAKASKTSASGKAASAPKGRGAPPVQPASPVGGSMAASFSPDVEPSPGVAGMTPTQIALAFAGKTVEEPASKAEPTRETPAEEDDIDLTDTDIDTDGAAEGQQKEAGEADEEDEAKAGSDDDAAQPADHEQPLSGLVKLLQEKGLSKIAKRVTSVFEENGQLKARALQAEQKPAVVLESNGEANPFSKADTPEKVDAQAVELQATARKYLRWLNRHPEGGTWTEGTNEVELTAAQVESAIEHWENTLDSVSVWTQDRKSYLSQYAETVKSLEVNVEDLVGQKADTREAKFVRAVPEMLRSPEYLQILADARAGRELREQKAAGKVPVFIDAAKAKATKADAEKGQQTSAGKGTGAVPRPASAVRKPATTESLADLRAKVEQGGPGSAAAAERLALLFAGTQ